MMMMLVMVVVMVMVMVMVMMMMIMMMIMMLLLSPSLTIAIIIIVIIIINEKNTSDWNLDITDNITMNTGLAVSCSTELVSYFPLFRKIVQQFKTIY